MMKRTKRKARKAAKLMQTAIDKLMTESMGGADLIAAYLEREGITGLQYRPAYCPVAQYVKRETGLNVTTDFSASEAWDDHYSQSLAIVLHPQAVSDFVLNFDTMKYPNLLWRGESSQGPLT